MSAVKPGQRFSVGLHEQGTGKPVTAVFTVIKVEFYPAHKTTLGPAPFYYYEGAMAFFDNGGVDIIDPELMRFCQPLVCLPRGA